MLNIGDIVKPKKGFKGNKYMFKIEERDESNYPYMYKLGRVEQELDPTYGPIDFQGDIIREVEHLNWDENELELIAPFYDVQPLYKTIPIINPGGWVSHQENSVKNEEDNMKILDIYKERKEDAILEDYEKKEEAVLAEDEMQKIINEMTDQVNALLESENRTDFFYVESEGFTLTKTNEKLDKLNEEKEDEILQLNKTIEEIEAMFELTEDYEERMKILKKYGIIDKDGKMSL
jgi:hypothetical protein